MKRQIQNLSLSIYPALVVGMLSGLSGCASITGTPNQNVSVQTKLQSGKEVVGVQCELTNNKGKWFVTTPGSVGVHRSNDDLQVLCTKEGIEPGRAAVVSDTKGSMFGNIIFGGGIGAIIDHNNGAAYEYPSFIQIVMGALQKLELPKQDQAGQSAQGGAQATNQQAAVVTSMTLLPPTPGVGAAKAEGGGGATELVKAADAAAATKAADVPAPKVVASKEKRLEELKALFDKGLVSKEAYLDQQRVILTD